MGKDTETQITVDEVIRKIQSSHSKNEPKKKAVLSQRAINRFNKVWKAEFISHRGRYRKEFIDTKKEANYKNCLFTIFTKHGTNLTASK